MTFKEYQKEAVKFRTDTADNEEYLTLGLIAEVGEAAGKLAKRRRDALIGYNETEQAAIDAWNWRIETMFTPNELDAIRRMFAERYPRARKLSEIEQSIIGKCKKALEGGSNEKH